LVAIATLGFTGWATLVQATVAEDQLAQSKQAAEEQARGQATRTAAWLDQGPDGAPRLHVANRSPDPVSAAFVTFSVDGNTAAENVDDEVAALRNGSRDWLSLGSGGVLFGSIGPCSELVVDMDVLDYTGHWNGVLKKHRMSRDDLRYQDPLMSFTDASGVGWVRTERDLMNGQFEDVAEDGGYFGSLQAKFTAPRVPPVTKQVPSCGSPSP
jgi:hypothetical protein